MKIFLILIGITLIASGAIIPMVSGLLPQTIVATGCGTFITINPSSVNGALPTPWNISQSEQLTTSFRVNTSNCLNSASSGSVSIQCLSGCGGGPQYPIKCNIGQCINTGGSLSLSLSQSGTLWTGVANWALGTTSVMTGLSAYPLGAQFAVYWNLQFPSPTCCNIITNFLTTYAILANTNAVFTLSASPSPIPSFNIGNSGTSTIFVSGPVGYVGPTSLSVNCSSSQIGICTVSPSSFNGQSGTSTLTVSSGCCSGSFSATVSVSGPTGSPQNIVIPFTINGNPNPNPDFSMITPIAQLPVILGSSTSATVTISSMNGFVGAVTLASTVTSNGICSISPTSGTLTSGSTSFTTQVVINATLYSASNNIVTCTITGTSGSLSHTLPVYGLIQPPSFALTMSQTAVNIQFTGTNSTNGSSLVTLSSINGFTGTISLSVSTTSGNGVCQLSSASVSISPSSTQTASLIGSGSVVNQQFTCTLIASSGSLTKTASVAFTVTPPSACTNGANNPPTCNQCPSGQALVNGVCSQQQLPPLIPIWVVQSILIISGLASTIVGMVLGKEE